MSLPAPRIEEHQGFLVVREDAVPGGTKQRVLMGLLEKSPAEEFVYASPAYGYAQLGLAHACRAIGRRATIFVAKRKEPHPRTRGARLAGARVFQVPAGRLNVVQARARAYAAASGAELVPFGMETEGFMAGLAEVARSLPVSPAEVWTCAGSGVLSRSLQRAWPAARFFAVQVGRPPAVGRATLLKAPETYEEDALRPPPFPSCSNYDAKVWRFMLERAAPGALFWNVGA